MLRYFYLLLQTPSIAVYSLNLWNNGEWRRGASIGDDPFLLSNIALVGLTFAETSPLRQQLIASNMHRFFATHYLIFPMKLLIMAAAITIVISERIQFFFFYSEPMALDELGILCLAFAEILEVA